ncbi:MAG: c-type cytochrome [Acidiferrobacterales bacterium]
MNRRRISLSSAVLALTPLILAGCEAPDSGKVREGLRSPRPDFVADARRGQELFGGACVKCHGDGARGTKQGPPLTDMIYRRAHHADITFYMAVNYGVAPHHWRFGRMPPVEGLTPQDVGHIIAYVRQEQRAAGIE